MKAEGGRCPSAARAHASGVHTTRQCMWPEFGCPHTPPWQLFSTCLHRRDAMLAAVWRDVSAPFRIPCALQGGRHKCTFQKMDHHLCGCVECGWVHRCDANQWCAAEGGDRALRSGKCPTVHMADGSVVCSITGVCIREVSFCPEYPLLEAQPAPPAAATQDLDAGSEQLRLGLREILGVVCAGEDSIYAKFQEACERRNALLQRVLHAASPPVCLVSVATRLENAVRELHEAELASSGILCYADPYALIVQDGERVMGSIIQQVHPFIFRLLTALKAHEPGKYKKGCLRWMLLGMLYMCTEGLEIMNVVILPRVPELRMVLPSDNKISVYFKSLGVGTKCITDTSTLIHAALKRHPQIFDRLSQLQ